MPCVGARRVLCTERSETKLFFFYLYILRERTRSSVFSVVIDLFLYEANYYVMSTIHCLCYVSYYVSRPFGGILVFRRLFSRKEKLNQTYVYIYIVYVVKRLTDDCTRRSSSLKYLNFSRLSPPFSRVETNRPAPLW